MVHRRAVHAGLGILILAGLAEFLATAKTFPPLEATTTATVAGRRLLRLRLLILLNRLTLLLAGLSWLCAWTSTSTTPPAASSSPGLLLWRLPGRMVRSFTHIALLSCLAWLTHVLRRPPNARRFPQTLIQATAGKFSSNRPERS
jgi:hypothetical protein